MKNVEPLLDLEPDRKMRQGFKFNGDYIGQLGVKKLGNKYWATSLYVNLSAVNSQVNDGLQARPIEDDDDAIERVIYNLNHEWLHYAFHQVEEHGSIEQEKMIYAVIGNGGNDFCQIYYGFEKNPEWDRRRIEHE